MSSNHSHTPKEHIVETDLAGGADLSRTLSIQLTNAQFEKLYLEPGGNRAKGDLTKRFANPTAVGLGSFLLCLTPASAFLMQWSSSSTASLPVMSGPAYFIGGAGLYLAAIFEFILGNTFTFTVFATFGGFWSSLGYFLQPSQGIEAAAGGAASMSFNSGFGLYLATWIVLVAIYLVASLRTNIAFVSLFSFLLMTFILFFITYLKISYGALGSVEMLLKATGAFGFLTCVSGWWIFLALVLASTGFPVEIPLGDLSNWISGKAKHG